MIWLSVSTDVKLNVTNLTGKNVVASSTPGIVKAISYAFTKAYPVTGSETIGQSVIGKVIIYNNYGKNQPLISNTRLLSPDGKLYRLSQTVMVPAGGSVATDIYADQATPDMEIGATHFTIPGLWAGLQDKIFAESKDGDIKFIKNVKQIIVQADLDNALAAAKIDLNQQLQAKINQNYSGFKQKLYKLDQPDIVFTIYGKVDQATNHVTVSVNAKATVVAFNDDKIQPQLQLALAKAMSEGYRLQGFTGSPTYTLAAADAITGLAQINASVSGQATVGTDLPLVDKSQLVNLSEDQANNYLNQNTAIAEVKINFWPSFIRRTPLLVDRIKVEVGQ